MDRVCKHCKAHCGRIVGRGLGEACYYKLRRAGRLEEYPRVSRCGPRRRKAFRTSTGGGQAADFADKAYFYCYRQRCTLRKAACALRQTDPPQGGAGSQIRVECKNCIQGRKILRELRAQAKAHHALER